MCSFHEDQCVVISDIHANLQALRSVLKDIAHRYPGVAIVCLGDIVGYGGNPGACIDLVRQHCRLTVMGNHERGALDPNLVSPQENLSYHQTAWRLAAHELDGDDRAWLRTRPGLTSGLLAERPLLLSHSAPDDDTAYLKPEFCPSLTAFEELGRRALERLPAGGLLLVGHTHCPSIIDDGLAPVTSNQSRWESSWTHFLPSGRKFIINPGSVGQPRDQDERASYCHLQAQPNGTFYRLHRLRYDVDGAYQAIERQGLNRQDGFRLYCGR